MSSVFDFEFHGWFLTVGLCVLTTFLIGYLSWCAWLRRLKWLEDCSGDLPLPPGDSGWPLIGDTVAFVCQGPSLFIDKQNKYGNIYKMSMFGSMSVNVVGTDSVARLMSYEPKSVIPNMPQSMYNIMGPTSVLTVLGKEHTHLKRKLLEAFSPTRLADYLPSMQAQMKRHIISWFDREGMKGHTACQDLVIDVAMSVFLGWSAEKDLNGDVRQAAITVNRNFFTMPIRIPGFPYYKAMKGRDLIKEFVKRRLASKSEEDHICVTDVLISQQNQEDSSSGATAAYTLTEEQVVDNLLTFLLAGIDTVSSALTSLVHRVGKHPDVRKKLEEEFKAAGLLEGEQDDELTYDVLQTLDYCQNVIKETLRLDPPIGGLFRKTKEKLQVKGFQIPRDWGMMLSITRSGEISEAFEEREAFNPDRWEGGSLDAHLKAHDPCSYMPYGYGVRACIGKSLAQMELTVFLIELVRLAKWTLHNPNPTYTFLPMKTPADFLPVTFSRKDKAT